MMPHAPVLTIGVPTYRRPSELRRALQSIADQDCRTFVVLVSNSDPEDTESKAVVESLRPLLPDIQYVHQPRATSATENFYALLQLARTPYFMWLADDDEISPGFVSSVLRELDRSPDAVTVTGHWDHRVARTRGLVRVASGFPQRSAVNRMMRFIWKSDDAFFYGVHRTEQLRQGKFIVFSGRNAEVMRNSAYGILATLVLSGRVLPAPSLRAVWINHDYTSKHYVTRSRSGHKAILYLDRRRQVYEFYVRTSREVLGSRQAMMLAPVALAAFMRDVGKAALNAVRIRLTGPSAAGDQHSK